MRKALPIWPRHLSGKHKAIGEMSTFERTSACNKCHAEVDLGRNTATKVFIEDMEFRAAERIANGQDSDFQE